VLDRAVSDSAFPGAYAVVGTADGIVAEYGAGRSTAGCDAPRRAHRVGPGLAHQGRRTTSALLQLVADGRVALDAPVARYLTSWTVPVGSASRCGTS
jgi:CubicO group peptidase (beta-lactamase class C family)